MVERAFGQYPVSRTTHLSHTIELPRSKSSTVAAASTRSFDLTTGLAAVGHRHTATHTDILSSPYVSDFHTEHQLSSE